MATGLISLQSKIGMTDNNMCYQLYESRINKIGMWKMPGVIVSSVIPALGEEKV